MTSSFPFGGVLFVVGGFARRPPETARSLVGTRTGTVPSKLLPSICLKGRIR